MFYFAYFCHEKATFFLLFFHLFGDSFFCCCLKQKNSFYLVWKKQVCGMFDYAGGCIITSFVDITFFFAISFLSSLSFKVLNWSKLSSDTSRLDPIPNRSRSDPDSRLFIDRDSARSEGGRRWGRCSRRPTRTAFAIHTWKKENKKLWKTLKITLFDWSEF